jgi:hypothetical protein
MNGRNRDSSPDLAKLLNPASLKRNLIVASLFLAAYETLTSSIVDQIRKFFTFSYDENGPVVDDSYTEGVLALDKHPDRASVLWLKEQGVISEDDVKLIDEVRKHRNELAHNLPRFITDSEANVNYRLLEAVYQLVTKIDRWWISEVEIPTAPDYHDKQVDPSKIQSGSMVFLQIILNVALGEEPSVYWDMLQKHPGHSQRETDKRH